MSFQPAQQQQQRPVSAAAAAQPTALPDTPSDQFQGFVSQFLVIVHVKPHGERPYRHFFFLQSHYITYYRIKMDEDFFLFGLNAFEEDIIIEHWPEFDDVQDQDFTSSESPSQDSDSLNVQVPSNIRKRKRPQRFDFIPRVVKHDIRRFYSRMIANVFNNHDLSVYKSFIETFTDRQHIAFIVEGARSVSQRYRHPDYPNCYYLGGIRDLLCFEAVNQALSPDVITTIKATTIRTRSDCKHSEVHCEFLTQYSSLYSVNCIDVHGRLLGSALESHFSAIVVPPQYGRSNSSNEVMRVLQRPQPLANVSPPDIFELHRAETGQDIPMLREPVQRMVRLKMILKLNERRQIESIFCCSPHQESTRPLSPE